jgi:glucoamylase
LCRSRRDRRIFDQPRQTVQRYLVEQRMTSPYVVWRFNNKMRVMAAGKILRFVLLAPSVVHWGIDGWTRVRDVPTIDSGLGVHVADLDTTMLPPGSRIDVTFYWPDVGHWEGVDFVVTVKSGDGHPDRALSARSRTARH